MEELKRIPLVRKTAAAADIMDLQEIEEKVDQYDKLWVLYTDALYELARKSNHHQWKWQRLVRSMSHTSVTYYNRSMQ